MKQVDWLTAAQLLQDGKLGILPTDTIYGLSASIQHPKTVQRIYDIKGRNTTKPLITLASSLQQICDTFPVSITPLHTKTLQRFSDIPTSIIYDLIPGKEDAWQLHDFYQASIAIRIPQQNKSLLRLLEEVGPIVSTSANVGGQEPETDPDIIEHIFNDRVDFIVNAGIQKGKPSQILKMTSNGDIEIVRGAT